MVWVEHHPVLRRSPPEGEEPIAFTPVPMTRHRAGGWTVQRQEAFIDALHRGESVAAAARIVGMKDRSAQKLRERPGSESFALAWEMAVDLAHDLRIDSLRQAIDTPPTRPVYYRGRIAGHRPIFHATPLLRLIKLHDKEILFQRRATERLKNSKNTVF